MFVFDNGKVSVLCVTRCGHTSMYEHFGIEPYTIPGKSPMQWLMTNSKKVVVLRHPLERMTSAFNFAGSSESGIFYYHCTPYLRYLAFVDFEYIPFCDIGSYIVKSDKTTTTNSTLRKYIPNPYFTEIDMQKEVEFYERYIQTRPTISAEEWKRLT